MNRKPRHRKAGRRSPLSAAQDGVLARHDEARREFLAAKPKLPVDHDLGFKPMRRPLGPPSLGDAAKLAAAILSERQDELAERELADELLIALHAVEGPRTLCPANTREKVAQAEDALMRARERTAAARSRVTVIRRQIHEGRVARGMASPDTAETLRTIFPEDAPAAPAVPWGVRPAAGTRLKEPAPTKAAAPTFAEALLEKVLGP